MNEILGEHVFLAPLKSLNDPDEGRMLIQFPKDPGAAFKYFYGALTAAQRAAPNATSIAANRVKALVDSSYKVPTAVVECIRHEFGNRTRIACFTRQPTNYMMWANYAVLRINGWSKGHAGICIEYEVSEQWRQSHPFGPVVYSDDVPVYDPTSRDEPALARVFYAKSREWRAEEEWRISYVMQGDISDGALVGKASMLSLPTSVRGVIFGMHMPARVRDAIVRRLQKSAPHLKFKHVVHNPETFVRQLRDL